MTPTTPSAPGLSVEEIECVSYESGFKEPAPSIWRIEVGGYCTDFETKQAAENFAAAVDALITEHVRAVLEAERGKAVTPVPLADAEEFIRQTEEEAAYLLNHCHTSNARGNGRRYIRLVQMIRTLAEKLDKAVEGLRKIGTPLDCGCKPCTGQCRSESAMQITVDEFQDIARSTLAAIEIHGSGKEGKRQTTPPLTQQGAATPGSAEKRGKAPAGYVAKPQTVSETGSHTAPASVDPLAAIEGEGQ